MRKKKTTKLSNIHTINMALLNIHVESIYKTSNWIFTKIIPQISVKYYSPYRQAVQVASISVQCIYIYTTWYLLYTSYVKYTVWWINKINQTLLISCLHTDIPQIFWLYFTLPAYFVKSKLLVWQVYNSNYIKFESCFLFLVSLNIARWTNNCEIGWLQTFNMNQDLNVYYIVNTLYLFIDNNIFSCCILIGFQRKEYCISVHKELIQWWLFLRKAEKLLCFWAILLTK